MRKIVIGDIHGCFDTLVSLLKKIKLNREKDMVVFLGDYTDRGPDSYKVYLLLKELKEEMGDRCVLVLGNHEVFVTTYTDYGRWDDKRLWVINGGNNTLDSFEEGVSEEEGRKRLDEYSIFVKENTVLLYECEEFFACHAGVEGTDPNSFAKTNKDDVLWSREAIKYGLYQGKLCFVGHTIVKRPVLVTTSGPQIEVTPYTTNVEHLLPKRGLLGIDTGSHAYGVLTAAIVENGTVKFVQNSERSK